MIVPVRAGPVFAAIENMALALPVPEVLAVIQFALLVIVQGQFEPVAVIST